MPVSLPHAGRERMRARLRKYRMRYSIVIENRKSCSGNIGLLIYVTVKLPFLFITIGEEFNE